MFIIYLCVFIFRIRVAFREGEDGIGGVCRVVMIYFMKETLKQRSKILDNEKLDIYYVILYNTVTFKIFYHNGQKGFLQSPSL